MSRRTAVWFGVFFLLALFGTLIVVVDICVMNAPRSAGIRADELALVHLIDFSVGFCQSYLLGIFLWLAPAVVGWCGLGWMACRWFWRKR